MDPVTGSIIIGLIQMAAQYAEKVGMAKEEATKHFLNAYDLAKVNDPDKLPDAKLPENAGG
jgi:hypothetical protein